MHAFMYVGGWANVFGKQVGLSTKRFNVFKTCATASNLGHVCSTSLYIVPVQSAV